MLQRYLLAAALIATSAWSAPKKAPLVPVTLKTSTLRNGLTVVRVPWDSPGLISFYTAVRVGSRNEVEAGHTGFAHFFEHMMFRGTPRFPEGARGALLGSMGFAENAFTSDDLTVYLVNGPTSGLEQLVDVEADRFRNLQYSEPAFQTEALAVLGEYHKNASNPGRKIEEAVLDVAFTQHTYRHTTLGLYADIQAMPTRYEYSQQFFKRWYTPDNCIVFVVGDFDDAKLMAWVEKGYGPWQGKAAKLAVPVEPPQTAPRTVELTWTTPTLPRLGLYWHTPASSVTSRDGALQMVLAQYLAGETSPLFKSLVLEKQLVEQVAPSFSDHRDPNLFGIEAHLTVEAHRGEVLAALHAQVDTLRDGTVDEKRLSDIKSNLAYGLLMGLESADDVALALAWQAGILGAPDALERQYQMVPGITAKDLVAFAKKHLTEANQTTLAFRVQPKGGAQ